MINKTTDLSVNITGINLKNPVIAASGTFGDGKDYSKYFDLSLLGGICTNGLTLNPKPGNSGIRVWETQYGLLNSIGLENNGIESFLENELPFLSSCGTVIIANLCGSFSEEYVKGAVLLNDSKVDMIELNISCPNVKAGGMTFGLEPSTAYDLVTAVRKVCTAKPLIVKLSPNCPSLSSVAIACVKAGADALSLVNTFKAMVIDTVNRKPVFDNTTAGLSGPAIKPIALRMVWELFETLKNEKLQVPLIGIGGISCTNDALEFLMAGALAIQVGSATFANPFTMFEIIDGIWQYMINNKLSQLSDISIRN
ncbi:MAG: dihydroorotate dehydrogenase [Treponema sp.]|jgi:dihydroorotate dehydrogenase (NAD+) catalytic subunit|nr:dihydroorotate dehydrogenase [Treponema sp.]